MEIALWISLPVLLVLSATASGSETALFSLTSEDRTALAAAGRERAAAALLARPRLLLIEILVLNMTVNVMFFVVSTLLAYRTESTAAASILSILSIFGIILCGEVLPKVVASSRRVAVAGTVAGPLLTIQRIGWPVLFALDKFVIGPLTRVVDPGAAQAGLHREELTSLVHSAGGVLDDAERSLLAEVLELRVRRARDVMAPRVDLAAVGQAWTFDEVRAIGRPHVPVSDDGLTMSVIGTIDARQALVGASAKLIPPAFVPESATLDQVLRELGRKAVELVYCVDELGEITGMVTIDDIVDELAVGTAFGEKPVEVGTGVWRVGGRMGVRDFAEAFEVENIDGWLAGTSVSTVGGLVSESLGHIPAARDEVTYGGFVFRVFAVHGRAVESVDIRREQGGGNG